MIFKCSLFTVTKSRTKVFYSTNKNFYNNNFKNIDNERDKLPIFSSSQIINGKDTKLTKHLSKSQEKENYISAKIAIVREIFGNDNRYPKYVAHNLPQNGSSPFHYCLPSIRSPQRAKRLSVTSLLTKSWCEIKFAYDIYSQIPRFTTSELSLGLKQHSNLELTTHPPNKDLLRFEHEWDVREEKLVDQWIQTIYRLVSLFVYGEAREIPCFAYIDSKDDKFSFIDDLQSSEWKEYFEKVNSINFEDYYDKNEKSRYTLLSGIIDHLKLKPTTDNQKESHSLYSFSDIQNPHYDVQLLFNDIKHMISMKKWSIQMSDVKTRQTFSIPKQTSVLDSSKIQVMYYNKFLSMMSKDLSTTYQGLLLNAFERGYNIDEPIHPLKIFSLIIQNPFLLSDMRKLKQGKKIGFPQFDNYIKQNYTTKIDLSMYKDKFNSSLSNELNSICSVWEFPLTLRYLAVRLSQLYYFVSEIISKNLLIEYYCRGVNFENLFFEYDESVFMIYHINALNFWFGKRDIETFQPNFYNFATFCKKCDYHDVCSWKKRGEDLCRELGNAFVSLNDNV